MSKIRVLSDHLANQIAAGEVVERPASVAKELIENSIDAGARRIEMDTEAGGRRLLRVADDAEGMTRDDAVLAFERHATSKISSVDDLAAIGTLGFRGEALASIAAVARIELITKHESEAHATRVLIEGGRMRDVLPAGRPTGTTITVRDIFFNVPARKKFLRSEATESFHLTNLVTHYALAHPEIAFVLTNQGREVLRIAPAADLRERAYQIFGSEFLSNLLEVNGGHEQVARVRGFVSAPRERRTSRDAQYLFVNGRFVRDRLVGRALSEGYRAVLPYGVYPAALLFLDVPLEEVDVNVHPAKTEVRFRRSAAVADTIREAVRAALASAGYVRAAEGLRELEAQARINVDVNEAVRKALRTATLPAHGEDMPSGTSSGIPSVASSGTSETLAEPSAASPSSEGMFTDAPKRSWPQQESIEFRSTATAEDEATPSSEQSSSVMLPSALARDALAGHTGFSSVDDSAASGNSAAQVTHETPAAQSSLRARPALPPLVSAAHLVREVAVESLSRDIRPLGQLDESFIIATDREGLLLIDQHVAHERILFDKYRKLEATRPAESQNLLVPETFDLSPAQAAAFDTVAAELEAYGFGLMRLSGRTVAIRAVPADLPAGEARNLLGEVLDTVDAEKRGTARANLRDEIAASLACRAAIKINTPLAMEKMQWLIDRVLTTSSPTTCPHGRPVILRLATRDIEKGFHRT